MMRLVRAALGACLLSVFTSQRTVAQNPPSPAQAQGALQQALQQNPGLADVIRQRIQQSGMTPDQIRARLQASGYPSNLLDAYLGGGAVAGAQPAGALEVAAVQALRPPPVGQSLLGGGTGLVPLPGAHPPRRGVGVGVCRPTTTPVP